MNKIELEIIALQSSVTHMHSYAVVLGEVNGPRRIPIVIGGFEAQSIALALENLQPKRPLTHDLLAIILEAFNIDLIEIIIYRIEDGIFYAKLICQHEGEEYEIDCRTSDAISLAIRTSSPIYAYEEILDAAGIEVEEDISRLDTEDEQSTEPQETANNPENKLAHLSIEELQQLLEEVLEQEDYTQAIKIRDEINRRKGSTE